MFTVATSGGPPKADPSWCEKYPDDVNCQGSDPLPMLFFGDYMGGASLLGLGDIVLPGLRLSFAARFDAAKLLLGVISGRNSSKCWGAFQICNGGYFAPLVDAIGLFMANTAVYLMKRGQPALLYLILCCLSTIGYMGWRRHELNELWHVPTVFRTADTLLYGEEADGEEDPGHSQVPTDKDMEAPVAPSAVDGNVPLLSMS